MVSVDEWKDLRATVPEDLVTSGQLLDSLLKAAENGTTVNLEYFAVTTIRALIALETRLVAIENG